MFTSVKAVCTVNYVDKKTASTLNMHLCCQRCRKPSKEKTSKR
jgi:hypothetical protein